MFGTLLLILGFTQRISAQQTLVHPGIPFTLADLNQLKANITQEPWLSAYNTFKNVSKATVTTTTKLDPALKAEFEKMAKTLTSRESIELIEKIDKEMIGGFVLNVGDKQIDASIKNKLKSLKVKFGQNPFIKEI